VKQVGRELGVRYVLEGSVRKAGNRVRITAQLIDALSGAHLWADRFDGLLEDIFELPDKVAISVAGVIEPTLRRAEIERARRKRPDSLDAYDLICALCPTLSPRWLRMQKKPCPCSPRRSSWSPILPPHMPSSPGAMSSGTCGAGCRRRRGTPLCVMRAKRSPAAAATRPLSPLPALSSPSLGRTMKPRSPHSTDRSRSLVRQLSRSVSVRSYARGRATRRLPWSTGTVRSDLAPSIP
jgi:hypothetical protein